ncbi:hypothetical protein PSHT_01854 [Puccinia striiformis]|uniref:Acyl-protein thioesterase 1 n=1 Tax=Puccinia striiformis TaxID=27350 RepID=A0A2S4WJK9_9BASI|nr:hypothetical protein PSHT_01854 [Puccinia striiformis]
MNHFHNIPTNSSQQPVKLGREWHNNAELLGPLAVIPSVMLFNLYLEYQDGTLKPLEYKILLPAVINPNNWTCIVLHGLGDYHASDSFRLREALLGLRPGLFEPMSFIIPSTDPLPVTVFGGQLWSTWFDIRNWTDIHRDKDIVHMKTNVRRLIHIIYHHHLDMNRTIIAGFSQGLGRLWFAMVVGWFGNAVWRVRKICAPTPTRWLTGGLGDQLPRFLFDSEFRLPNQQTGKKNLLLFVKLGGRLPNKLWVLEFRLPKNPWTRILSGQPNGNVDSSVSRTSGAFGSWNSNSGESINQGPKYIPIPKVYTQIWSVVYIYGSSTAAGVL